MGAGTHVRHVDYKKIDTQQLTLLRLVQKRAHIRPLPYREDTEVRIALWTVGLYDMNSLGAAPVGSDP